MDKPKTTAVSGLPSRVKPQLLRRRGSLDNQARLSRPPLRVKPQLLSGPPSPGRQCAANTPGCRLQAANTPGRQYAAVARQATTALRAAKTATPTTRRRDDDNAESWAHSRQLGRLQSTFSGPWTRRSCLQSGFSAQRRRQRHLQSGLGPPRSRLQSGFPAPAQRRRQRHLQSGFSSLGPGPLRSRNKCRLQCRLQSRFQSRPEPPPVPPPRWSLQSRFQSRTTTTTRWSFQCRFQSRTTTTRWSFQSRPGSLSEVHGKNSANRGQRQPGPQWRQCDDSRGSCDSLGMRQRRQLRRQRRQLRRQRRQLSAPSLSGSEVEPPEPPPRWSLQSRFQSLQCRLRGGASRAASRAPSLSGLSGEGLSGAKQEIISFA